MKILVDADSCPAQIRKIIIRAAIKRQVLAFFVAAQSLSLPSIPEIQMVQVEPGIDAADEEIMQRAEEGDIIVTRDIPLAARLVNLNINVIDDRGRRYTKENIGPLLSKRNFMASIAFTGIRAVGEKVFSHKEVHDFAATFDRELNHQLSIENSNSV